MCIDLSPAHPQMVVAGLYDGNVAVWDLTLPSTQPTFLSSATGGKAELVTINTFIVYPSQQYKTLPKMDF